jgi:hypothetical protein
MRCTSVIALFIAGVIVSGCAVVRTTASVTGTVLSTTVGVAGAVVKGTARAASSIGSDDEDEAEQQD